MLKAFSYVVSWNAYIYVRNNPIHSIDIFGLTEPKSYMSCGQTHSLECESKSPNDESYDYEMEIINTQREVIQETSELIFGPITEIVLNVQDSPLAYTLRGEYWVALDRFMKNVSEGMRPENLALMSSGLKMEGFKPVLVEGKWINAMIEAHHLLPIKFEKLFNRVGLNIEDFVIPLDEYIHRRKVAGKPYGLHTGQENCNKQWQQFFDEHPGYSYTQKDVLKQLRKMRKTEGI